MFHGATHFTIALCLFPSGKVQNCTALPLLGVTVTNRGLGRGKGVSEIEFSFDCLLNKRRFLNHLYLRSSYLAYFLFVSVYIHKKT